jgi:hypothetical protein
MRWILTAAMDSPSNGIGRPQLNGMTDWIPFDISSKYSSGRSAVPNKEKFYQGPKPMKDMSVRLHSMNSTGQASVTVNSRLYALTASVRLQKCEAIPHLLT